MIGVFDSGYGGLTVFKPLIEKFPAYDFIYFGDNARAPYGSRQPHEIYEFTRWAVDWLFKEGCELIILACNTASSQALRKIQQEYLPKKYPKRKVLGVLIPVAEAIANALGNNEAVGILATEATIKSGAYLREIQKLVRHPVPNIVQVAAPKLVPLIEEGKIATPEMKEAIRKYLKELKRNKIKNIVLGCTHYPLIKDLIQKEVPKAKIFDSPSVIPASLKNYLMRHPEIEQKFGRNGLRQCITTGDPEKASRFAKDFLNLNLHFLRLRNTQKL